MHDESCRKGSLQDVIAAVIDSLYQCQREYNLSDTQVDDGAYTDLSACHPGDFNKLIEGASTWHPDAELIYVTPATQLLKLSRIVKEELLNYLKNQSVLQQALLDELVDLAQGINDEIWAAIQPRVHARMTEEFGQDTLVDIIQSGQLCSISEQDLQHVRQIVHRTPLVEPQHYPPTMQSIQADPPTQAVHAPSMQ